jgi:hypothetical protein
MGWKSFEDLAENDYGSIWVERNREKIGMNRVWGRSAVFIKCWVNGVCPVNCVYVYLTLKRIFFLKAFRKFPRHRKVRNK